MNAAIATEYTFLDLKDLVESPTNPRKTMDQAKLEELAEGIKRLGVIVPILARPHPTLPKKHEIVIGHRRSRASKLAGLTQIPANVRPMTDLEVIETQALELSQGEPVHPLEEADLYRTLLETHHLAKEDIAAKTGRELRYVEERLRLVDLVPAARKAYFEGALTDGLAVLVARVPDPDLQEQALEAILKGGGYEPDSTNPNAGYKPTAMSLGRARDYIRNHFMLQLGEAPFSRSDAELLPTAGPCTTCPKRTGNQTELFADVKAKDLCTDPKCWAAKKAASWKAQREEAKAAGQKLITEKEAKGLFSYGNEVRPGTGYVDPSAKCDADPKRRTWRQLLGKNMPAPALARDSRGKPHQLLDQKEAVIALEAAGHTFAKKIDTKVKAVDNTDYQARYRQQEKERLEQRALVDKAADSLMALAVVKLELGQHQVEALRFAARVMTGDWRGGEVIKRRTGKDGQAQQKLFHAQIQKMDLAELIALLFEAGIHEEVRETDTNISEELAKLFGADWKKLLDLAKDATPAEPEAKAKKKGKPGKKAAAADEHAGEAGPGDLTEERFCSNCECTESNACEGGCSWVPGATIRGEPVDICNAPDCYAHTDQAKAELPAKAKRARKAATG